MIKKENKDTIESINTEISQLYAKINELNNKRTEIELFTTKTVIGKYWKIERPCHTVLYMKCNECFTSGQDVIMRGECFYYKNGALDCTYFHFDTYYDTIIDKNSWNNTLNLYMTELTPEQYKEKLHSTLEQFDSKYWG